jgi:hypothetical protein
MDERYDWELSEAVLGSGRGVAVTRKAGLGALVSMVGAMAMVVRITWLAFAYGGRTAQE